LKPRARIIVADDDASIMELLQMILEDEGYEVRAFNSPVSAIKEALVNPPDAMIVDLMMPGMTGIEVVEALRKDCRTNHVPVLVCSAFYGDLRRMIQKMGRDGVTYLRKPFQIEELVQLVNGMIAASPKSMPASGSAHMERPQHVLALRSETLN
jgi:DNA-binding response OmpR family regulator